MPFRGMSFSFSPLRVKEGYKHGFSKNKLLQVSFLFMATHTIAELAGHETLATLPLGSSVPCASPSFLDITK